MSTWTTAAEHGSICDLTSMPVLREKGWRVILDEEFLGSTLNASLWTGRFSNYTSGHENEAQSYVPRNAQVSDGHLVIESDHEKFLNKNYTSAWIDTQGKFEVLFGRICIRAQFPGKQPGFWPAHWLMPAPGHGKTCWPGPGEVDIMEMINGDGIVHGSLHYNPFFKQTEQCVGPHLSATSQQPNHDPVVFGEAFHEFAIEWNSESLTYFVDGVKYLSTYPSNTDRDGVPQVPMYIILNSALGGPWAGNPTSQTQFPIKHTVDYVRVLQSDTEPKSSGRFTAAVGAPAEGHFSQRTLDILSQRSRSLNDNRR